MILTLALLLAGGTAAAPATPIAQDQEPATATAPQDEPSLEERVDALEEQNELLRTQLDATAAEMERFDLRDVMPPVGESYYGLGPAASKVYSKEQGLSIGGYGEMLYQDRSGDPARLDLLRAVFYFGYKFNERWIFNSEVEFEHASTGEEGSASVEFAYLDYRHVEPLNVRVGMVLIPMGFINEMHEPTTYLEVTRPETESRIIPSTWRENGAGLFGDAGQVAYRAYVVNGLDATGFRAQGLRGGRQKGSKALAEDLAIVGRLDWTNDAGLRLGGSAYFGGSGQGQAGLGDTNTLITEAHAEFRHRGLWLRALGSFATVDDVAQLNQALGLTGDESVGEELWGAYVTLGYDVMPHLAPQSATSLSPFVRWERFNTQAKVPEGYSADPANDETVLAAGLDFKPIDQIVFKTSYQDWDRGEDRFQLSAGYVF